MNCRWLLTILLGAILATTGCGDGRKAPAPGSAPAAMPPNGAASELDRRILYYRNPMGLADTSPVPKKDSMGMDYVPVYTGEEAEAGRVRISADKLQKLGVRTEAASRRALSRTLHIVGTLQVDERRQWTVSPKFEGWITELYVNTTGAAVHRGDALLDVYSPDLVSAEEDYRIAAAALGSLEGASGEAREGAEMLVRSSAERLRNFGIATTDLQGLRQGGAPRHSLVLRAERDGVVLEKTARAGMRFMAGEALYQLADLSVLWLIGSVAEQDLALVRVGQRATATTVAYPGRSFSGTVTFISPVLQPETRTAQVRIELANHAGLLKPAMFGSVDLLAARAEVRLTVPESAILDTGTRQLVLVDRGGGAFEPREIRVGARGDGYAEILAGLADGEPVVVNGNFLIDAESNLRSAIGASRSDPRPADAGARDAGAPPPPRPAAER
jgi:membrane fusion protein, copper/silver efflux system